MEDQPRPQSAAPRLATLAIVAAAVLVVALGLSLQPADPPRDLSASLGVLDEGIWSHNAVNATLVGTARLDDLNPMYVTSAPHLLIRASYALFGLGIIQTRLPSIALGALTVVLVGFIWGRRDPLAGVVAASLLATTYLFLAYSRLGLLETPAAGLAVGALACVIVALERRSVPLGAAGGALLAVAVTSKLQIAAAVLGTTMGLAVWSGLAPGRRRGRVLASVLGAFALVGTAWAVFVVTHLDPAVRAQWRQHALGIGLRPGEFLGNASAYLRASDGFGAHAGPLLIAAAAGLALQVVALATRKQRPDALQFAAAGWAVGMVGALAVLSYRPSRYAVLALPGLALTAAGGIPALRALVGGLRLSLVPPLALGGAAAAAAFGLASWWSWASHPEWSVREFVGLLRRETAPSDVVAGGWALVPATEARRRVVVPFPLTGLDSRCPIERHGVDFLIHSRRDKVGREYYDRNYPGLITSANLVARVTLIGQPLEFYRVPEGLRRARGCERA